MKKLLLLFALGVVTVLAGETNTIFTIDFETSEGYVPGDVEGQNNWVKSWWGGGGIVAVSNNTAAAKSGDQFLYCDDSDSQYGTNHQTSFDISELCPGNAKLQVSFWASVPESSSNPFFVKLHALGSSGKNYDVEIIELTLNASGDGQVTYSNASGQQTFKVGELAVGSYQYCGIIISPATRSIEEIRLGDQVIRDDGMLYKSASVEGCGNLPDGIRIMHSGRLDNFKIETCPLPPDKEFDITPSQPIFSRTATEVKLTVANKTTGSFEYTVTVEDSPEWLSVTPAAGTCEGAVELTLSVDRNVMTDGYFRAMVTIDGGEYGSKTIPVCCPNGSVIYAENFESPYMHIGGIDGQNTWVGDYQHEGNEMVVTNVAYGFDGNCGYVVRSGGYEGYMCDVYSPTGGILTVSMKMYKGSAADSEADYFYIQNDVWYRSVSFWFVREKEQDYFYLYSFGNGPAQKTNLLGDQKFPLDTWLDFSFTVDYRRYLMTDLTLGDFTTNFGTSVELSKKASQWITPVYRFTKFCMSCGANSTDAMWLIDNLKFEDIPRPETYEPQLNGVYAFGETETVIEDTVVNGGSIPFQYEVTFLDYPENVFVTTNATGVIEESGKLSVGVKRDGLDDGFFRSRMRYAYGAVGGALDNAITSLVTFAKGGWYYDTDFSAPFYAEGNLKGQDYWEVQNKGASPYVSERDSKRAVYFPESSFASVPALSPVGSTFTVNAEFLMEKNENTTYVDLTQNGETGFLPIRIRRDKENNEALIGYMSGADFMEWFRAPLDKWNTLSFTLDTDVAYGCALSCSVNGVVTNFAEGDVPLNGGFDDQPLKSVGIKTQNDGPDELYATGVWFSKLSAHDVSVPEPVTVGLLAIALALSLRKR
ncbi:BACON domain-containing protein [bacterium]|nr:BACON domain-containing protein [bacterium]